MIRKAIKQIACYLTISYFKWKGASIAQNIKIHFTSKLELGIRNGQKGKLVIKNDTEFMKGVVVKCYGGEVVIGENVFLGEFVVIYGHGGVVIGNNTLIAMHTCIISANHTIPDQRTLIRSTPDVLLNIKIGSDVWIGAGVKILGGITIGDGCIIGAGSVVTKDLPPYSVSVGVPARVTRFRKKQEERP